MHTYIHRYTCMKRVLDPNLQELVKEGGEGGEEFLAKEKWKRRRRRRLAARETFAVDVAKERSIDRWSGSSAEHGLFFTHTPDGRASRRRRQSPLSAPGPGQREEARPAGIMAMNGVCERRGSLRAQPKSCVDQERGLIAGVIPRGVRASSLANGDRSPAVRRIFKAWSSNSRPM